MNYLIIPNEFLSTYMERWEVSLLQEECHGLIITTSFLVYRSNVLQLTTSSLQMLLCENGPCDFEDQTLYLHLSESSNSSDTRITSTKIEKIGHVIIGHGLRYIRALIIVKLNSYFSTKIYTIVVEIKVKFLPSLLMCTTMNYIWLCTIAES